MRKSRIHESERRFSSAAGFGGYYRPIRDPLTRDQILKIIIKIEDSQRFTFGEWSHVVLRGTNLIMGYVGNESVHLCCPHGENPNNYQVPHKHLTRIYNSV